MVHCYAWAILLGAALIRECVILFSWHKVKLDAMLFTIAENKGLIIGDRNSGDSLSDLTIWTVCDIYTLVGVIK